MTKELDIAVHTLATYPEMNNPIKMEVGIEECLHIEFEYNKSKYHLKDVIVGKIYFLLVRIKIKHMEIAIIKRETTGSGPNTFHENETIAKYEIMDGAPVRGESIPIRVFLAGYDLTPTMRDINKKFSVRYYLNLVLVDEEERRYFKQQEITLWRKGERVRKLPLGNSLYQQQHALARHEGGEQPLPLPEEGEKIEDKPLEEEDEEARQEEEAEAVSAKPDIDLTEDRIAEMEDTLAAATEEKLVIGDSVTNPPDLVTQVASADLGHQGEGETDSLADLDIVTREEVQAEPPDRVLDSPPAMPDSPASSPASPALSLPDAPGSEPGSPDLQKKAVAAGGDGGVEAVAL